MIKNLSKLDITVLYVEDDPDIRDFCIAALRRKVTNIVIATDGEEGLNCFIRSTPDLVITDIRMPKIDGLKMARKIKELNSNIQIIVTSAYDDIEYLVESIDIGISQYVFKPFDIKKLYASIERAYEVVNLRRINLRQEQDLITANEVLEHRVTDRTLELQSERDYVKRLIENNPALVISLETDGTVKFINNSVEVITKYSGLELIGKNWWTIFYPLLENIQVEKLYETFKTGDVRDYELPLVDRNGDMKTILWNSINRFNESGGLEEIILFGNDITERKKMEEQLIKAKELAETSNRAKSTFLANMNHELRIPLNGIIGLLSLFKNLEMTEKQKEYLQLIDISSQALLRIINDILDISKIEAGKLELVKDEFNLRKEIKNVIEYFEFSARSKGLELNYGIAENIPDVLYGDLGRIKQVLHNLIGNAVKFTDKGKIDVTIYDDKIIGNKIKLFFHIKDSGIGIAEDKIQKLFKSFSQLDSSITRKYGGTGLGLAISKQLVEMMDGNIFVESEDKMGSDFYFYILLEFKNQSLKETSQHIETHYIEQEVPEEVSKVKILLVEDSSINEYVMVNILQQYGFKINSVQNGKSAIEILKKERFDLVLMDIQLPDIDGYQTTHLIRKEEQNTGTRVPIIAITAFSQPEHKIKSIQAGMDEFVVKPIKYDDLIRKIGKLVKTKNEDITASMDSPADLSSLLQSLKGNKTLLQKLIDHFIQNYPENMLKLYDAIKNNQLEIIKTQAHQIKSSLGYFGAFKAVNLIAELEKYGKSGSNADPYEIYQQLEDEIKKLKTYFSNMKF